MPSTKDVCEGFFNFSNDLNRGHGIITSIYQLIRRRQQSDPSYFNGLERRIERSAIGRRSPLAFQDLLKVCWDNGDVLSGTKWTTIAYIFFVTDKVDCIARRQLAQQLYAQFKTESEKTLSRYLQTKYGDNLSSYAWDMMHVAENMQTLVQSESYSMSSMILCAVSCYALYDIFSRI